MTEREVRAVLGDKPLASGDVEAGSFKIYGSSESVDVLRYLHYSNILVIFRDGKVSGVYSGYMVPGGEKWRREIQERFSKLPRPLQKDESEQTKP